MSSGRRQLTATATTARLTLGLALPMAAGLATYAWGVWDGRFLELRSSEEICLGRPVDTEIGIRIVHRSGFPLSDLCRWPDGHTLQLVPAPVNPILYLCLTAMAATVLVTAGAAWRGGRRRVRPGGGSGGP